MTFPTSHVADTIVINWHLLEPCQFSCKYCYAQWGKTSLCEVYKSADDSVRLIGEIAKLRNRWQKIRISFAGGEPFLDKNFSAKIQTAHNNGLAVSIITNGDLLSESFLYENAQKLSMLGISIDSLDENTNLQIGRATKSGKCANHQRIISLLRLARQINPNIQIKINTVVNRYNFNEDLTTLVDHVRPDKWKVLRVLPTTSKSSTQEISDQQFAVFKKRHANIPCAIFEDNECMKNSYLMIDPYSRFFFNGEGAQYNYSKPILDVGIERALAEVDFDASKFVNRYPQGVE